MHEVMEDTSLLLQLGVLLATITAAFYTMKSMTHKALDAIERLEDTSQRWQTSHHETHKDLDQKMHAVFRRVDDIGEKVTILERDTAQHIDKPTADDRYVQHKEMQRIETKLDHISEILVSALLNRLDLSRYDPTKPSRK